MYRYGIPLIPNTVSWWISNSSDRFILALYVETSMIGLYAVSYKIPTLLTVFSSIFVSAWQISAVESYEGKDYGNFFGEIYQKYSSFNNITCAFLLATIVFLAKILFAKEFFSAWIYAPILVLGYLFYSMSTLLGTVYTTAKKTDKVFITTVVGVIVNIIGNLLLIPIYEAMGAAIATAISYFIIWLVRLVDSRSLVTLVINFKKDIICYALLLLQVILYGTIGIDAQIYVILLFLFILYIERKFLLEIIKMIYSRKKHGEKIC